MYTTDLIGSGQFGKCAYCKLPPTKEGHDGCLGTLSDTNIMNACCGHGDPEFAYIQYWDGSRICDKEAISEQHRLKSSNIPKGSYLKLYPLPEEMTEIINEDLHSTLQALLSKGIDIAEVETILREKLDGYHKDGWLSDKENL